MYTCKCPRAHICTIAHMCICVHQACPRTHVYADVGTPIHNGHLYTLEQGAHLCTHTCKHLPPELPVLLSHAAHPAVQECGNRGEDQLDFISLEVCALKAQTRHLLPMGAPTCQQPPSVASVSSEGKGRTGLLPAFPPGKLRLKIRDAKGPVISFPC